MQLPALIVGDLHIDERNLPLFRILKQQLSEYSGSVPTLVFIGDIFNSPDAVKWVCLLEFLDFLEETSFEVYLLTGNHDRPMYGQLLSNLAVFNRYGHVIRAPNKVGDAVWIPHIGEQMCLDFIKETPGRVCFSHQMIRGLMLNDKTATAQGLDKKEFQQQYEFTFNGHIHQPQIEGNFFNVGSPWQHSFAEAGQRKFIWLFTGDKAIPVQSAVDPQYFIGIFSELREVDLEGKFVRVLLQPGDDTYEISKYLESKGARRWILQKASTKEVSQLPSVHQTSLDELLVDFGLKKDLNLDDILVGLHFLEE